jgi:hypothetical protein
VTAALIKLVHVGARELGLDEDTRRGLQLAATGKDSLKDMTVPELESVVRALTAKGFRPSAGKGAADKPGRRGLAPRGDLRFCHALWGNLVRAGAVQETGAKGLNAFIRARFEKAWGAAPIDIDQMRDAAQIAAVAEALKGMCRRAGIEV